MTAYATFYLDDQLIGVPVERVQEVLQSVRLTPVPLAPPVVAGLLNLRGQIVVAQDLRVRLGWGPRPAERPSAHAVVRLGAERVSLVFDRVGDVLEVNAMDVEPVPPTMPDAVQSASAGVAKRVGAPLLLLLDLDRATAPCGSSPPPPASARTP
jgi:purine-binding chemotaxis protein CheW